MKTRICNLLFFVFIIGFFFNIFWMIYQCSYQVEEMTSLEKPLPISKMDSLYILEDDSILIHNPTCGIFQCFDFDGKFIWGLHLSTDKNSDSTLVSYNNKKLYFWESKTDTVYIYENSTLIDKKINSEIMWRKNFYSYYPMDNNNKFSCQFTWDGSVDVKNANNKVIKNIKLETDFCHYTLMNALFGVILCLLGFFYVKNKLDKN